MIETTETNRPLTDDELLVVSGGQFVNPAVWVVNDGGAVVAILEGCVQAVKSMLRL